MSGDSGIAERLETMHRFATAGFVVSLHVGIHAPLYLFQTFPPAWIAAYASQGLARVDPTVAWGLAHAGRITWADLAPRDAAGVLTRAAAHGLVYGLTVANHDGGRSIASFARGDRPFEPEEAETLEAAVADLHGITLADGGLDDHQREVLRRLSVAFSRG